MSAPLKMTAYEVDALAKFLKLLNEATRLTHINACPYQAITVSIGDNHGVQINWDSAMEQYVVDEQVGS